MIRRILITSILVALSGCEPVQAGDDAAVAQAIGAVQPSLEAQSALLVGMNSCVGCKNLQELGNYLGSSLKDCATVEAVPAAESACTRLSGKLAAKVKLDSCDLGLGRPVSGTLVVAQADGSVMRYFETDLQSGDHGVVSCGQISGVSGVHNIAFDAVAHGPTGGDVLLAWNGPAWTNDGLLLRAGSVVAQFTGSDGVGYAIEGEASDIARGANATLPHAGKISFQGTEGTAVIEFGRDTPATGGIHLTRSNGGRETVVVAR
jgi:hypothetical protein